MRKIFALLTLVTVSVISVMAGDLKTNVRTALVMAYSPANSVYEDDNIKLEIYNEKLWATNKTNRTIFIDLSQCFGVNNGASYPLYEKEGIDEKNASKRKHSTSIDEYVSIAPATGSKQNETFICGLSGRIYGKYSTTETPSGDFSEYEERLLTIINEMLNESLMADPKGDNYFGTSYRHLTEDESVSNIGVSIAYAFNKKSEDWTPVSISTWVSDLYVAPFYVEMPPEIKKEEKSGFGLKKTEAAKIHIKADTPFEFASDKSPVIVCDWVGDFKKGEFYLNPTWIKKKKGKGLGTKILAGAGAIFSGGISLLALINTEETHYKSEVHFAGQNDDWGELSYMKDTELSKFGNKR